MSVFVLVESIVQRAENRMNMKRIDSLDKRYVW